MNAPNKSVDQLPWIEGEFGVDDERWTDEDGVDEDQDKPLPEVDSD